jgi:hypothetical protein
LELAFDILLAEGAYDLLLLAQLNGPDLFNLGLGTIEKDLVSLN